MSRVHGCGCHAVAGRCIVLALAACRGAGGDQDGLWHSLSPTDGPYCRRMIAAVSLIYWVCDLGCVVMAINI
jgi:hypothetical protein